MKEPAYKIEYLEAEAIRRILSTFQPEKIILFGSYIYGNPSYDSDLDILIEFKFWKKNGNNKSLKELLDIYMDIRFYNTHCDKRNK